MAGKVDPRTGKPDDKNGRDPRGGPADDIPYSQFKSKGANDPASGAGDPKGGPYGPDNTGTKSKKKFKKLTKAQAQQIAKRRMQLKQRMAQSKRHK